MDITENLVTIRKYVHALSYPPTTTTIAATTAINADCCSMSQRCIFNHLTIFVRKQETVAQEPFSIGLQTQTVQGLRLAAVRHISSCVTKPPFIYCFSFSSPLFVRMDLFYSGERQP
ncbi:hypothetical protein T4B_9333 [Trichinella pseudospiralis]|uniref:Uncharacterized protein n=1 Tax=Trichinella pseudospiralis TaxID=6337 RepID=A0A0V1JC69_TRIPS|nr:hypothetical protein T4B_9333 [Trichinella pseudospiralis]